MLGSLFAVAVAMFAIGPSAQAQVTISENFNGPTTNYNWLAVGGACLTAGTYSSASASTTTVPGCTNDPYYTATGDTQTGGTTGTLPDATGSGALRFTDATLQRAGGVISNFTFPSSEGVQITFVSVIYGGNGYNGLGSDGISFFLLNADVFSPSNSGYVGLNTENTNGPVDVGAWGGSLGYDCSNANNDSTHYHPGPNNTQGPQRGYDGLVGAYIGLGIDEKGDFTNWTNDTASGLGTATSNTVTGNTIALRGYGSVAWSVLAHEYPKYYPSTLTTDQMAAAVHATCVSGYAWDYSQATPVITTQAVPDYSFFPKGYHTLPSTGTNATPIATESASVRGNAKPITYNLTITPTGLLSLSYSYNGGAFTAVLTNQDITANNGPLPSNFYFGFAGTTGGSGTNIHEILCFNAAPSAQSAGSSGIGQIQSSKVEAGPQVYFGYYNPNNWSGYLAASSLSSTGSINTPSVWDAECTLTGVATGATCANTQAAGPIAAQAPTSRTILTWNGSAGAAFEWSSLSAGQQAALNASNPSSMGTTDRLNFLRGDRGNEVTTIGGGEFRPRASVLGDIVDSSPSWVGPPASPYNTSFADLYDSGDAPVESGYAAFSSTSPQRTNIVYVGANDGMLHGFNAGTLNSDGSVASSVKSPNDGSEAIAYMPAGVVNTIHSSISDIDYSNPQYSHAYYADATPGTGDLYYNGAWHTWVVSGLGPGGAEIFALDVTNPAAFSETGSGTGAVLPSTTVIGDWTASSTSSATQLTCTSSTATVAAQKPCTNNLGNTYGTPQIRRFHNGQWGAIFGNGYGSASGASGIFIMMEGKSGGTPTFYYIATPSTAANNGIAYVTPVDLDGDHITDYVYAGDLAGNVWRFDLTSTDPTKWNCASTALFTTYTTPATVGSQPISTKLVVAIVSSSNSPSRVIVSFGTGQQIPFTTTSATTYASGQQDIYGVWDWNFSAWNAKSGTQFSSLASAASSPLTIANLVSQIVTTTGTYRTITNNTVCWADISGCSGQYGWYVPLPGASEQITYNPTLINGDLALNTTIPANGSPLSCTPQTPTGFTMAINVITGGPPPTPPFINPNGTALVVSTTSGPQEAVGDQVNGTGSLTFVNNGASGTGTGTVVTQTSNGTPTSMAFNPGSNVTGTRLTWIEKR
jgi:type IV pilus assembly protein PilY1